MARTIFWIFLLAGLISPMVSGQYTADYETTDDGFDDNDDEDAGEDEDTNVDYSDVFNDYFDDEMRVVDVDQDVAIEACVSNSDALVQKIDSAYDKCFKDFEDWSEFQENNVGNDKDKDGLSDEYEADEACFYKKMGWVVNNEADKEAIKKDFENLNLKNVKNEFVSSIDACSGWNGKFKGRKKRDAEEDSWALSLARERRAAKKEGKKDKNGGGKGKKNNKGTRKGRGKGRRRGKGKNEVRKGRRGSGKNKKGAKKGRGKGRNRRNKNKKNKDGKGGKNRTNKKNKNGKGKKGKGNGNKNKDKGGKKESGKSNNGLSKTEKRTIKQLLPESVYNQLWCYELSVERALEECIETKILP